MEEAKEVTVGVRKPRKTEISTMMLPAVVEVCVIVEERQDVILRRREG